MTIHEASRRPANATVQAKEVLRAADSALAWKEDDVTMTACTVGGTGDRRHRR
jgi:hypothetical protein